MTADLAPEGWIRSIEVQGHVQGKSESGDMQADAAHVEMWPRVNQAKLMTLHGNVRMNQRDPKTQTGRNLVTNVLQLNFAGESRANRTPCNTRKRWTGE